MQISNSLFSYGVTAINAGQQRVEQAAGRIAGASVPDNSDAPSSAELALQLVELQQGRYDAQIGSRLVRSADEVLGTLIDTRA